MLISMEFASPGTSFAHSRKLPGSHVACINSSGVITHWPPKRSPRPGQPYLFSGESNTLLKRISGVIFKSPHVFGGSSLFFRAPCRLPAPRVTEFFAFFSAPLAYYGANSFYPRGWPRVCPLALDPYSAFCWGRSLSSASLCYFSRGAINLHSCYSLSFKS